MRIVIGTGSLTNPQVMEVLEQKAETLNLKKEKQRSNKREREDTKTEKVVGVREADESTLSNRDINDILSFYYEITGKKGVKKKKLETVEEKNSFLDARVPPWHSFLVVKEAASPRTTTKVKLKISGKKPIALSRKSKFFHGLDTSKRSRE